MKYPASPRKSSRGSDVNIDVFFVRYIQYTMNIRGGATGRACDQQVNRSWVQILLEAKLRNNLGQVVHTYVPLSPCKAKGR